jgi:hypothetical protein
MTVTSALTTAPVAVAFVGAPSLSSLAAVLADLGHDCPGSCATAAAELGASIWFIRRRTPRLGRADATLVVLDTSDYDGPMHRSRQLMREVYDCVRHDGIRITERRIDDSGRALAPVRPLRMSPSAPAVATPHCYVSQRTPRRAII